MCEQAFANGAADADEPAAFILQPPIERGIKPVQILQQHGLIAIQQPNGAALGLRQGQGIDFEFRATQRQMMSIGDKNMAPCARQRVLQFVDALPQRRPSLLFFAAAP